MLKNKAKFLFKKYITLPLFITRLSIVSSIRKDGIEHAGYLAFLSFLSLFPFLIFLVSIAADLGQVESRLALIHFVLNKIPNDIAHSIEPRILEILNGPPQSILTVAIIGIIWTASSTVEGMRTILNRSYRVFSPPPYIWRRLLSILQFFVIVIIIVIASVALIVVPAILKKIEIISHLHFNINYDLFYIRPTLISLILVASVSALYYFIPNVNQKWDNTVPGSIFCVSLWSIILKIFGIYIEKFNQFNLVYGSLAGMIGALIFFYLINLGFIVGAEFNYHFFRAYSRKKPKNEPKKVKIFKLS